MIYLFTGEDILAKDQKIAEIKKNFFPTQDVLSFDYEILHASSLEADTLKKSLLALPALASQRLVVIRSVQKLNSQNRKILLDFIEGKHEHVTLVLDCDEESVGSSFANHLSRSAEVVSFSIPPRKNVFDMTRAMSEKNSTLALSILSELIAEGTHPLQIMGGVIWFWKERRRRLSLEKFKKGLAAMQEGDLCIKRSRLRPDYCMEMLVVKLTQLIG